MIRQVLCALALFPLVGGIAVSADDPPDQPEPPVRLKKKEKPKSVPAPEEKKSRPAQPEKKDGEKKDDEPEPADPEQNEQEVLDRVAKNMRESENRLNRKDAGDGTQQVQRDIVKDLESLIKQSQQSQQQQSSEQQSQQAQSQNQEQKNSRSSTSRSQRSQQVRRRTRSQSQQQQTARTDAKRNQSQQPPQQGNANQGSMGGKSQGPSNKLAEIYKDVWGHLPEQLRLEMEAYSREQFMPKYNELLKQYYSTIAEKGRRKGD